MAVIKIVPMPGAVGDKGDEGAPGAQGPQGPAGQNGLPGTPALWSYQGAYNPAAAYAVGDVVTYQGQLYYTKSVTTAGTLPTNTTKFDLIAAKGADGTNGTNGTNGANGTDGATPFTLIGAYDNGAAYNLGIAVYYNGGTYVRTGNPLNPGYPPTLGAINESWTPIAEKGSDSISPTSGTWNLIFNNTSGTLVESAPSNLTYAEYYTIGELVYFDMQYSFQNVTNYGLDSYLFNLPFPPKNTNNFSNNTLLTGLIVDTTYSDIGSNVIYGTIQTLHPITLDASGWVLLKFQETASQMELSDIYYNNVASLPGVQSNPYNRIRMSGVYRKA